MKKILVLCTIATSVLSACGNNSSAGIVKNATDSTHTRDTSTNSQADFFPVSAYIGGQLKMIDSLQLPLSKSVTVNGTTKYAICSDKELRFWANKFQEPDISKPEFKNQYKETNIADESGPSVTLIYTAVSNTLPLQKINVFIKPDPVQNDKVTGVYIEKSFSVNDTIFNEKLYWKTGKNLQITTEKKIKTLVLPVEQLKITWDAS